MESAISVTGIDLSKKVNAVTLVKTFFGASLDEMKTLPAKDRVELASGIARYMKIPSELLSFTPVAYEIEA